MSKKNNRKKKLPNVSRRGFLGGMGACAGAAAVAPLMKVGRAFGGNGFNTKHVVVVGIGGGLRSREALGMAEGATMPNLFGRIPLIGGFGGGDAGDPVIAPEYAATRPQLVLPPPLATPLASQGTVITNLRYAEGAPGHLQGQACLLTGYYNNIENRADARLPVPTIFELHRKATGASATDTWYISNVGGFYSALQTSDNPEFGPKFAGRFLSPPGTFNAFMPIVASGKTDIDIALPLPSIRDNEQERATVGNLISVLDGNSPNYELSGTDFRATVDENAAVEKHLAGIFSDPSYQSFFPDSIGIGISDNGGGLNSTGDGLTIYQAERILETFKPAILGVTLIDVDVCHGDFNGYLRGQQLADALVTHLWNFIESTPGLAGETTMVVLPEHGRHLFFNGQNPDSLGRSGIDHGQGDDGDRDLWVMMLGPDIAQNQVIAPTGITGSGRPTDRYETIDAVMTTMALLGHDTAMASGISGQGGRPGLVIDEVLA